MIIYYFPYTNTYKAKKLSMRYIFISITLRESDYYTLQTYKYSIFNHPQNTRNYDATQNINPPII